MSRRQFQKISFNEKTRYPEVIDALVHVFHINPAHPIKIYYNDTYHIFDVRDDYTLLEVYQDFIVIFSVNNFNIHEMTDGQPGDYHRLIFLKDIKSIEF